MTQSSLTEETPATPGWVDARVAALFAPYGATATGARDAYLDCLASVRGAVDVDIGHDRCRVAALRTIAEFTDDTATLDRELQALEAEIAAST